VVNQVKSRREASYEGSTLFQLSQNLGESVNPSHVMFFEVANQPEDERVIGDRLFKTVYNGHFAQHIQHQEIMLTQDRVKALLKQESEARAKIQALMATHEQDIKQLQHSYERSKQQSESIEIPQWVVKGLGVAAAIAGKMLLSAAVSGAGGSNWSS